MWSPLGEKGSNAGLSLLLSLLLFSGRQWF
jgi:hypothetical protein